MAKIVLRDGTNGARTKIIARLKSELTHAFMGIETYSPTLGSTMTPTQIADVSSDTMPRVRQLNFSASTIVFQTTNDFQQLDDNKITLFFILSSRSVNKLVLVKPSSSNWLVNGIITFDAIYLSNNQPYYLGEIKIEVLDQV
jgi:hypothetical protein